MSCLFGKFDSTASFYASKTSKLGKNEIHLYPLQHEASKITAPTSLSSSFELDSESELVNFDWIQQEESSKNKRSKRRHSVNGSGHESSSNLSYLAASFKSGTILVYSPFKKEVINEFKTNLPISVLTSSSNSFWVAASTDVYEYALNDSKPKNQISLPKSLKEITTIKHTIIGGDEYLLVGGNKLVVYNITKDELVVEYPAPKGKKSITINSIAYTNNHVAISRNGESNIYVYSLTNKRAHRTLTASGNVESLTGVDDSTIGALTKDGVIEIYKDAFNENTTTPSFSIKTNKSDIGFSSLWFSRGQLYLSWFDFEPKFETVKLSEISDDLEINIQHVSKTSKQDNRVAEQIVADIEVDESLEVRELEFASVIEKNLKDPSKLLTILVSNSDLNKIKFTSTELTPEIAVELFRILKERVESNPSESAVFNNWIKWLLMAHSGPISHVMNLKSLKGAYSKSLKQLPNLLSLQGRLEMLQSQLQLRNQIASNEVLDTNTRDPVERAEESIVYVNGENDEGDDDVIGSFGNSESDEESSEDEEQGEASAEEVIDEEGDEDDNE